MDEESFPIEKKNYTGGVPRTTELGQNQKIISKNINLPGYWHFTIWKDKINSKLDSESQDIYLTPCKKAKRSDIYFSCYRRLKLAYFCRFRCRDELSRKFVFLTIFTNFSPYKSQFQTFITQRVYKLETYFFWQNLKLPSNFIHTKPACVTGILHA